MEIKVDLAEERDVGEVGGGRGKIRDG